MVSECCNAPWDEDTGICLRCKEWSEGWDDEPDCASCGDPVGDDDSLCPECEKELVTAQDLECMGQ